MDAIVTARVPIELKEQGSKILKSIGASQTDLVNSAYRFLLSTKRLPSEAGEAGTLPKGRRSLTDAQKTSIASSLDKMRLGEFPEINFKDALNEARDDRFANFS